MTAGGRDTPFDVDAVMRQVHIEVARRQAAIVGNGAELGAVSTAPGSAEFDARWEPAAPRLPVKSQYVLADFLGFNDADFVDVAYSKILRRPADDAGSQDYLRALRSGTVSKVEVLGLLRFSEEGRSKGVHVDGLLLPYKLHRWRRKRIVGWFIGMGMAIARLPRLAWHLQRLEAAAARESHELGRLVNCRLAEIQTLRSRTNVAVDRLRSELSRLADEQQAHHDGQGAILAALQTRLGEQGASLTTFLARLDGQEASVASFQARVEEQGASFADLRDRVLEEQRRLRSMMERLTVVLDVAARQVQGKVAGQEPDAERQYAAFEDAFRGERSQIKRRVAHYLRTLIAAGIEPNGDGVILDLGSGRGEWLEVLSESGYRGRGVDLDRGMLAASRDRGHEVVEADAVDFLRVQDDNTYAAITAFHVVEHIPHLTLIQLLDQAKRVLRPGGVLILETPNPENVLVGACTFYLDPTHRNPIPPQLLQWVVQNHGFEGAAIERLTEHRGSPALLPVSSDTPGAAQLNQMVAWFTAPPDYAVIARKPRTGQLSVQ